MNQAKYNIIRATANDAHTILQIERETFKQTPWHLIDILLDLHQTKRCVMFLMLYSNKPIGYICTMCTRKRLHITQFAVLPAYQKRGFGQKLLNQANALAHVYNMQAEYLEVRKSNVNAQHLYYKNGFKIIKTRKLYYFNPLESAYIMQKEL